MTEAEIISALLTTAGALTGYAQNPPYRIGDDYIVPLTTKSCQELASLLEKAALALAEKK